MIIEFDWKQGLVVARSRCPKERSRGGRQSPELDIRLYRQNIYPVKLKFIYSWLEYLG